MIKDLKICGISDPETLNFILNHPYPPKFIGFITNYKKSKRYVNYENLKNIPSGVSIESASYMENNNLIESNSNAQLSENEAEYTPKLFSDEESHQSEETIAETDDKEAAETEQLFEKEINEEEDFEIPAFLRKQKF